MIARQCLCASFVVLFSSGWAQADVVSDKETYNPREAYFLIGVEPASAELAVVDGEIQNGHFIEGHTWWGGALWSVFDRPTNGFLLVKSREGKTLFGTIKVRFNGTLSTLYSPCAAPATPTPTNNIVTGLFHLSGQADGSIVFNVNPGKVTYVTNVTYTVDSGDIVRGNYRTDLKAARAFLAKYHSDMVDHVQQGNFQVLPAEGCVFR